MRIKTSFRFYSLLFFFFGKPQGLEIAYDFIANLNVYKIMEYNYVKIHYTTESLANTPRTWYYYGPHRSTQ